MIPPPAIAKYIFTLKGGQVVEVRARDEAGAYRELGYLKPGASLDVVTLARRGGRRRLPMAKATTIAPPPAPVSAAQADDDARLVHAMLRGMVGEAALEDALTFVAPGTPIPKARARWSPRTNAWYTPTTTKDAEQAIAWQFRAAATGRPSPAFPDTVAIAAVFYVPTFQPKDLDNLLKLVCDAGNQARVWVDDRRVIAQASLMELDRERPRTVVAVCPKVGTLSRAPLFGARP